MFTITYRCGGRLPGYFSPSQPTWLMLPLMLSLHCYFFRQPDHDDDDGGGEDDDDDEEEEDGDCE